MILTRISLFALVCFLANQTAIEAMDTEINKSLIAYASLNDMAGVVKCLQHGAQVNAQNSEGQTALHCVIVGNSLASTPELDIFKDPGHIPSGDKDELVGFLIEQKADVNVVDRSLQTPMHYAAQYDRIHALALLRNASGDLNAQNDLGSTPCHKAVDNNSLRATAWLAQAGADMNWIDNLGMTPLHDAVQRVQFLEIHQLLSHGARLDIRTKKDEMLKNQPPGSTVFHLAATPNKNSTTIQRLLLYHALFHPEGSLIKAKELLTFLCCFRKDSPAAYVQRNTILQPLLPYVVKSLSPQLIVGFLSSNNNIACCVARNLLTERLLILKTLFAAENENGETAYQLECNAKIQSRDKNPHTLLLASLYDIQQFIFAAQTNNLANLPDSNIFKAAYAIAHEQQQPRASRLVDSLKISSNWIQQITKLCTIC